MSALSVIASATMLAQTVRMAIPYACASLGGVLSERSGVVNIALEGTLLTSAFASVAMTHATGSVAAGLAAGMASGAAVGLVHALLVVRGRIDAIVSGLALNLVAAGGTRFALRALYGSSSNSPSVSGLHLTTGMGRALATALDPFVLSTLACAALLAWGLRATRIGLHVRACGEDPAAAKAVGIDVTWTRTLAVTLGGAVCGLGGTALAFELHQFQSGMTGGRGFIALAAVILAGWRAWPAVLACLAFAALDALQIVLQNETRLPPTAFAVLPFGATLVALSATRSRSRAPAGLGKSPEA